MPRPNTPVIPDNWDAHHRPVAENAMTSTGQLLRPSSTATFDETTGRSVYPDPAELWTGPVRVQRIARRGGGIEAGDRSVEIQLYQVSIPISAPEPQVNDQIVITAIGDDPALPGKVLRIAEVRIGSNVWQRDMTAEETTPTTR